VKTYPRVFKKAVKCAVGGKILTKRGDAYIEEEFLLKGDPVSSPIEKITVEIADEETEKFFLKHNKNAIVNGYLLEITEGYEMELDEVNAVTDGFLKDLLKEPYAKMKSRVDKFTSPVPVSRILKFAIEADKPYKTIEFLKNTLRKFDTSVAPSTANLDGVKVSNSG